MGGQISDFCSNSNMCNGCYNTRESEEKTSIIVQGGDFMQRPSFKSIISSDPQEDLRLKNTRSSRLKDLLHEGCSIQAVDKMTGDNSDLI